MQYGTGAIGQPDARYWGNRSAGCSHGHVFAAWILISSGSDIIIQIRTRGFGVI